MDNNGNGKENIFKHGKDIGENPVFQYCFIIRQIAGVNINKETAWKVKHHPNNKPEWIFIVDEDAVFNILHLLVKIIERENQYENGFYSYRSGIYSSYGTKNIIRNKKCNKANAKKNDKLFKTLVVY